MLFLSWLLFCSAVSEISAWQKYVLPIGRTVNSAKDHTLTCDWSLCGIHLQFVAEESRTFVELEFHSTTKEAYVVLEVNCKRVGKFKVDGNKRDTLSHGIDTQVNQTYDITIRKITEAALGPIKINEVSVIGGQMIEASKFTAVCDRPMKFLVFGDSITAGYGTDGRFPCGKDVDTQDATHTYATYLAEHFHADLQIIAWSGKGVVHSVHLKGVIKSLPFPQISDRILGTQDNSPNNYWNPQLYQPDLVMVALGLADFLYRPYPSNFDQAYTDYIRSLQKKYPRAKFLMIYDPIYHTTLSNHTKAVAKATGVRLIHVHRTVMSGGVGCNFHPNAASHKNIAHAIKHVVEELLSMPSNHNTTTHHGNHTHHHHHNHTHHNNI